MAPLVQDRKGEHEKLLAGAKQAGFVRVRVDGQLRDLDEDIKLDKKYKHSIDVVVDRVVVRQADDDGNPRPDASRMADSIETVLRLSEGILLVNLPDAPPKEQDRDLQREVRLPGARRLVRGAGAAELQLQLAPRRLSGLHRARLAPRDRRRPRAAERRAVGRRGRDPSLAADGGDGELVLEDPRRGRGASRLPDRCPRARPLATRRGRSCCTATSGERVDVKYRARNGNVHTFKTTFEGVIPNLTRRYRETGSEAMRSDMERYMTNKPCPTCNGMRLKPESLSVTIAGKNIIETTRRSVTDALAWYDALPQAPERAREPDRPPGPQGDPGAARLPRGRRARLPDPRPRVRHAVRRRGAADPAGHADRLVADGRALHPRRAIDRPPPARQRPAHRDARPAARPRQHAPRRRARRGDDPLGRLGDRHRSGGGRARRSADPLRAAGRAARESSVDHGGVPARGQGGAGAEAAAERQGRGDRRARGAREQPEGRSTSPSRSADSWRSPG